MESTNSSILMTLHNNGITTILLNIGMPDLISFEPGITLQSYEMWNPEKIVLIIAHKMRQSDVCLKVLITGFYQYGELPLQSASLVKRLRGLDDGIFWSGV